MGAYALCAITDGRAALPEDARVENGCRSIDALQDEVG